MKFEEKIMPDFIVITFLGWPAMISSLLFWLAGLTMKKYLAIVIAGVIILPFSLFYIGAYLNSIWLGALFALGHFGSALAVNRNRMWLAWALIVPYSLFVGMLAYIVLTQSIR